MTRRERRGDKEKKGDTRARMSKQCVRERETRDSLALRLQDRWVCVGENCTLEPTINICSQSFYMFLTASAAGSNL